MKVSELLKQLKDVNPDATVLVDVRTYTQAYSVVSKEPHSCRVHTWPEGAEVRLTISLPQGMSISKRKGRA